MAKPKKHRDEIVDDVHAPAANPPTIGEQVEIADDSSRPPRDEVDPPALLPSAPPPAAVRVILRGPVVVERGPGGRGGRTMHLAANEVFRGPMAAVLWRDARDHVRVEE